MERIKSCKVFSFHKKRHGSLEKKQNIVENYTISLMKVECVLLRPKIENEVQIFSNVLFLFANQSSSRSPVKTDKMMLDYVYYFRMC